MTQLGFNGLADQAQRTVEYILNTWREFDLSRRLTGDTFAVVAI